MGVLLNRFQQFCGDGTRQIGRNFCIPASLCNAVRIFGITGCTQERLRDEWYAENGKIIEPNLDDQMDRVGIGIFETMERRMECMSGIDNELFTRQGDSDLFNLGKADVALQFIENHIKADHPVIVSTWNRVSTGDIIEIRGFHMWLVLDFDRTSNLAVYHDSAPDEVRQTTITRLQSIKLKGQEYQLDMGLRGCVTHSDYTCLALWKEPA